MPTESSSPRLKKIDTKMPIGSSSSALGGRFMVGSSDAKGIRWTPGRSPSKHKDPVGRASHRVTCAVLTFDTTTKGIYMNVAWNQEDFHKIIDQSSTIEPDFGSIYASLHV